jgi:hypothetical protein
MVLPVTDTPDGSAEIEALLGARAAFVVEHAVDGVRAMHLRDAIRAHGYARYELVDRGSYDHAELPLTFDIVGEIVAIAAKRTARSLAAASARAIRLRPGDYLLAHHDRVYEEHPLEAILDLSPTPVAAEVHYRRRGHVFFRVPSEPGALSLVERGPTVTANHTYVSQLQAQAEIVRLVVLLRDAAAT